MTRAARKISLSLLIPLIIIGAVRAQTSKLAFDVASIKPTNTFGPIDSPVGRFVAAGQTVKGLIGYAYRLRNNQVLNAPGWTDVERWEIQATVSLAQAPPPRPDVIDLLTLFSERPIETTQIMLQSLLEERFHLKSHRETRELPIYELTVGSGGPKVPLSPDQDPLLRLDARAPRAIGTDGRPALTRGSSSISGGNPMRYQSNAVPISGLINMIRNLTGNPVIDKTGLTGLYDIKLEWAPDTLTTTSLEATNDRPFLPTAVQEQLGLRLTLTKGPVEVLIIDSVERPTPN